jgi:hypothetical protein
MTLSCSVLRNAQLTHKPDRLSLSPPARNKHILIEPFGFVLRELLQNSQKVIALARCTITTRN